MSLETDRIEADLNESRHRLNDTLDALGSKLSPGQMLDEGLGLLQGQAGEFAGKLGRQVRDNPIPAVLIATGIVWLMRSNSSGHSHSVSSDDWGHHRRYHSLEEARWATSRRVNESDEDYDHRVHQAYAGVLGLKQKAGEAAHEFKARVGQAVEGVRSAAAGARDRIERMASDAKHFTEDQARKLGDGVSDIRHRTADFYEESPLSAGAIAMAIGALLGGAAPLTRQEREGLRGVADRTVQAGADLAERGARVVDNALDRAVH